MPTTCEIELRNNPSQVVYTDETLRGTVHLTLTNEKVIHKAFVNIVGYGYVHWSENVKKQKYDSYQKKYFAENHTEERTSQENYLHKTVDFISNNDGLRLSPGTYHYPFEAELPQNLPTSFNGTYGHIRYGLCVKLDIKDNWIAKKFETSMFTVVKAINLNLDPRIREPVSVNEEKIIESNTFFGCWASDSLEITARIPVGGYVPGQTINLGISVKNKSDKTVENFQAKLMRYVQYIANGHKKNEEVVVAENVSRGCEAHQNKDFRINIEVPSIPPTEASASKLIKIQYSIVVKGSIEDDSGPLLDLPVVIGVYPILDASEQRSTNTNVPLLSSAPPNLQQPGPSSNSNARRPNEALPHPSAPMKFLNDELPSYEDAMRFGDPSDKEYTPKYPIFKRKTSYSTKE